MIKTLFAIFIFTIMLLNANELKCDDPEKLICLTIREEPMYKRVYAINLSNNDIEISGYAQVANRYTNLDKRIIKANSKVILAEGTIFKYYQKEKEWHYPAAGYNYRYTIILNPPKKQAKIKNINKEDIQINIK
jgi:hypothetical protein